MPTYEYRCKDCGHGFEIVQSFTDDALTECPSCAGSLRKVFGSVGITFKGSGFYKTDSRAVPAGQGKDGKAGTDGDAKAGKDGKEAPSGDGAKGDGAKQESSPSGDKAAKGGGAKQDAPKPSKSTSEAKSA